MISSLPIPCLNGDKFNGFNTVKNTINIANIFKINVVFVLSQKS